jgi:hypothetical protein
MFTDDLNSHIEKEATRYRIPIRWWPSVDGGKNGAKLQYVEKYFARRYKGKGNFTYCILTDKEPVWTFASKELPRKQRKGTYYKIYKVRKPVKQYYIYFHDKYLGGPCCLKMSSYFPFPCQFYFNGHNAIKLQLDKKGISYKMKGNAFMDVSDPDALQNIANDIRGKIVQQRINYWMNRFFKFDKKKYSTRSKYLQHEWYMGQTEICSNVIFKSPRFCTNLFERLLVKFTRIGWPDSISQIFTQRPRRPESKRTWRLYDDNACVKNWFRKNSIKQYNKTGYLIRTETTINNPKALGLKKPVAYLQAYLWFGHSCNNRLMNCCADVDITSIPESEPELFSKPVPDHKGRKITAPDLRNDRQLSLFKELLKAKYSVFGFRTADLLPALRDYFSNSARIRYELRKLIVRGVVEKKKNHNFYVVTQNGLKWLWVAISSITKFSNPMISKAYKKELGHLCAQPSKIENAYCLIDQGLTQLTQELAMVA